MGDELASSNVNRAYSLATSSIAIFTFTLFFLYPRFRNGEADVLLFQATVIVMGVATFSFVFASWYYYHSSLRTSADDVGRLRHAQQGDRFWLLGITMLLLAPSLILFSIGLVAVGSVWLALWLAYLVFVIRQFPRIQAARKILGRGGAGAD